MTLWICMGWAIAGTVGWESVLEKSVPSVVVIRMYGARSFDTEGSSSSVATGFIVDAERGLILTNRHVVMPGPVVAEAHFQDNEEVALEAVYRDPVHDFGVFRFDPSEVEFMAVKALPLRPEHARVGAEIRLVGNDAGEKISILSGTLARLDRAAPRYGQNRYNDFNTFYIQAASGSSGGSSGSPVIDAHGHVVALNAGSRKSAASSFFLPLDRVVRALDYIRKGEVVPRGTLQATFQHRTYDEVERLGLQSTTQAAVRRAQPNATGMLVIRDTLPGGPAHGKLAPGDVLTAVDGVLVTDFIALERTIDDKVGEEISVTVERGGIVQALTLTVGDLHAITPSEYLEVGGAVLNPLSYQLARQHQIPVTGVAVAALGYVFGQSTVSRHAVITDVNGVAVPDLDAMEQQLARIGDGQSFSVGSFAIQDPKNRRVSNLYMDRKWFPSQRCKRDERGGQWTCAESPLMPDEAVAPGGYTQPLFSADKIAKKVAPSLVMVRFDIPYKTDGVYGQHFRGVGVVVDAKRGLVLCDRDTIPVNLGDVHLNFGGAVDVPGEVVALHPTHNLALIRYKPSSLRGSPFESAKLSERDLERGDAVTFVGLRSNGQLVSRKTEVLSVEPYTFPKGRVPFFRQMNLEVVRVQDSSNTLGGVLVDSKGRVNAMWASYPNLANKKSNGWFLGMQTPILQDMLASFGEGRDGEWGSLEVEWRPISLAEARRYGLPESWSQRLEAVDPERREVLMALAVTAESPAKSLLAEGDMLVAIDGLPVTRLADVRAASQAASVHLEIVRAGQTMQIEVPTVALGSAGQERVVLWAGALLQAPYRELSQQMGQPEDGVYVSVYWYGSPAGRYKLSPMRRIVAVDGVATPDLDAFLAAVAGKEDRSHVRLSLVDMEGRERVKTLKLDLQYWPTQEVIRTESGWVRRPVGAQTLETR